MFFFGYFTINNVETIKKFNDRLVTNLDEIELTDKRLPMAMSNDVDNGDLISLVDFGDVNFNRHLIEKSEPVNEIESTTTQAPHRADNLKRYLVYNGGGFSSSSDSKIIKCESSNSEVELTTGRIKSVDFSYFHMSAPKQNPFSNDSNKTNYIMVYTMESEVNIMNFF